MSIQSSSSSSKSKPKNVLPKKFRHLGKDYANTVEELLGGRKSGQRALKSIPQFSRNPADYVAPIGANETALLENLQQTALDPTAANYLKSVIGGDYLPGQGNANPFLEATITAAQRPTLQGLEETLGRTLPGRFTQAGHFVDPQGSSAFDRAAAVATRGVAQTIGDIATNISFGVHEGERGRQQEAVQLSQQQVQSTIQNLQAQALPRLIQDLGIERGLSEFQSRVNALLNLLGVTTQTPLVASGTQSSSESSGFGIGLPNPFTGIG